MDPTTVLIVIVVSLVLALIVAAVVTSAQVAAQNTFMQANGHTYQAGKTAVLQHEDNYLRTTERVTRTETKQTNPR